MLLACVPGALGASQLTPADRVIAAPGRRPWPQPRPCSEGCSLQKGGVGRRQGPGGDGRVQSWSAAPAPACLQRLGACVGCCISVGASPEAQNVNRTRDPVFHPGCPGFSGSVLLQQPCVPPRPGRGDARLLVLQGRWARSQAPAQPPPPCPLPCEAPSLCPREGVQRVHVKSAGASGCGTRRPWEHPPPLGADQVSRLPGLPRSRR